MILVEEYGFFGHEMPQGHGGVLPLLADEDLDQPVDALRPSSGSVSASFQKRMGTVPRPVAAASPCAPSTVIPSLFLLRFSESRSCSSLD